jgi:hypothetical protein
MSLHFHFASSAGTAVAVLLLAVPAATMAGTQSLRADQVSDEAYEVTTIHDRLTDSTRVTVALNGSSRRFGLGSRIWLDVSFTHAGPRLTAPPEAVVLTLASFTPARGGWAFAHPQRLRIQSGKTLQVAVPAAEYEKLPAGLFDAGRREMLSFRIATAQFVAMAAEPELELKAGTARMRLRKRAMGMLRDVARRLTPASAGAR